MATLEKKGHEQKAKMVHQPNDEPVTQYKNASTGHWILRDTREGQYIIGGEEPFEGVKVREVVQVEPHPAVSRETALLAEKAVIKYMNKKTSKANK